MLKSTLILVSHFGVPMFSILDIRETVARGQRRPLRQRMRAYAFQASGRGPHEQSSMPTKSNVPHREPHRSSEHCGDGEEHERLELPRVVEDDAHCLDEHVEQLVRRCLHGVDDSASTRLDPLLHDLCLGEVSTPEPHARTDHAAEHNVVRHARLADQQERHQHRC